MYEVEKGKYGYRYKRALNNGWRRTDGAVLQDNHYDGNITRFVLVLTKAGQFWLPQALGQVLCPLHPPVLLGCFIEH